ncbi:hypothetical protein GO988_21175 [Hymenobacter sp. HMF4947]|uniref:Uncharacterized protein n=1 Tax=Hymenobacter ginkgonis TaxID=2682976 RepID=A0A7K1TL63_9BACT|nr:hypothetical protein [Hymenobacter ginkgonis]MVN78851.1 hypothetical protein [Hymenobacter ginkgonis]
MRTAYFSDYLLPGQAGRWLVPRSAAEPQATQGQTPHWPDELTRHQAIYEELLASPDWAGQPTPPPAPRQRTPSVRDLTRDLAGWSLPQPGRRPAAKSSSSSKL